MKFQEIVDRPSEEYLASAEKLVTEMLLTTRDKLEVNKAKIHEFADVNDRAIQLLATRLGAAQRIKLKLDALKRLYPIS